MLASAKFLAASQLSNECIFLCRASLTHQRVDGTSFLLRVFILEFLSIEGVAGEVLLARLAFVECSVACREASILTRST